MSKLEPSIVALTGELTLKTIGAAHLLLLDALKANSNVTAVVDEAAVVDLSLAQLLEAARRSAADAGGSFNLTAPATGGLLETLRRGGFLEAADQRSFWLKDSGDQ